MAKIYIGLARTFSGARRHKKVLLLFVRAPIKSLSAIKS